LGSFYGAIKRIVDKTFIDPVLQRLPVWISNEMRALLGKYGGHLLIGTTFAGIIAGIYVKVRKFIMAARSLEGKMIKFIRKIDKIIENGKITVAQ